MNGISAAILFSFIYFVLFCVGLYVFCLILLILRRVNKLLRYKLQEEHRRQQIKPHK